ncbi:MAG TPA: HDOD domain-containing protein [Casimicrobiaceae bacterium]|nr:HDOD domain-containing protein [Casimicrobiaceae bacterium]
MEPGSQDSQRAYSFLQVLTSDLSNGKISFPTFTGATLRVRNALADESMDADRLARVVMAEPLLAARIIKIANSAALNPTGRNISDVRSALLRVGSDVVRSTAVALAMEQLRAARDVQVFHTHAEWIWRHSLEVGAISFVLARGVARLNPDEALFAGLVHDIGSFYLLARASQSPELVASPEQLDELILEWHPAIGQAVLHEFSLSDATLTAVAEHEHHTPNVPARHLVDVVAIADRLALRASPPRYPKPATRNHAAVDNADVLHVVHASAEEIRNLVTALRG